jgi:replicative DNA helicase
MLLDAVAIVDATAKLRPEDFALDSHQRIYRAMMDLVAIGHAVDFITVIDALSKKRELDAVGGQAYIAFLTEGIPRNPNIESYVKIIKDKSLLWLLEHSGHRRQQLRLHRRALRTGPRGHRPGHALRRARQDDQRSAALRDDHHRGPSVDG